MMKRDDLPFTVPPNVERLISLATWDLWYGPITEPDDGRPWPGFAGACQAIRSWVEANDINRDFFLEEWSGYVSGDLDPDAAAERDDWTYLGTGLDLLLSSRMERKLKEYV